MGIHDRGNPYEFERNEGSSVSSEKGHLWPSAKRMPICGRPRDESHREDATFPKKGTTTAALYVDDIIISGTEGGCIAFWHMNIQKYTVERSEKDS